MNTLHKFIDEKVDVYAENARWYQLLLNYNGTKDETLLTEMWPIMFRCASNILKKRFGKYWGWEKISDVAIDMCEVIMNRITNKTKRFPKGYNMENLPTIMRYAMLNAVYGPNARKEEIENSHSNYDDYANMSPEDMEYLKDL